MKPLRGRLLAELIPEGGTTASGLIIIDRKSVASRAEVEEIGQPSMRKGGEPFLCPAKVGDIVYFKRYTPMQITETHAGMKKGKVSIWWDDIVGIKRNGKIQAVFDDILIKVIYKDSSPVIIIPDVAKKRIDAFHGEVISVGEEYPYDLKVGDKIIFARDEGLKIEDNNQEYFRLAERRVLAKLGEDL